MAPSPAGGVKDLDWHGQELLRLVAESKERDVLDAMREKLQARQLAHERRRGEVRGQIVATFDGLRQDATVIEDLRILAWTKAAPDTSKLLAFKQADGSLGGIPEGWPSETNAQKYVDDFLNARRDARLAAFDEEGAGADDQAPDPRVEETPSVKALRRAVALGPSAPPAAKAK